MATVDDIRWAGWTPGRVAGRCGWRKVRVRAQACLRSRYDSEVTRMRSGRKSTWPLAPVGALRLNRDAVSLCRFGNQLDIRRPIDDGNGRVFLRCKEGNLNRAAGQPR